MQNSKSVSSPVDTYDLGALFLVVISSAWIPVDICFEDWVPYSSASSLAWLKIRLALLAPALCGMLLARRGLRRGRRPRYVARVALVLGAVSVLWILAPLYPMLLMLLFWRG